MRCSLSQMQQTKYITYICCDEAYKYYEAVIYGIVVMYRQNIFRPDGRRLYYLNNALAKLLGYGDIESMMLAFPKIRYWRRFISVQSLEKYLLHGICFIQDDS